jgi:F-type H+-transporting ATPase subunit epsilon
MRALTLHLQDSTRYERIDGVLSFVGQDATGLFGILPGHERMLTSLTFGLARFRTTQDRWQYLALPKALLYCVDDQLYVSTRRYLRDEQYARIAEALERQLVTEEQALREIKMSLRHLQEQLFQRLWRLGRGRPTA